MIDWTARSLLRGCRPVWYYLIGQGAVLFSVLFTVLTTQTVLTRYYLAPQILKWCSVFELLFFSIGLADLLNEERRMRDQAQKESGAAQAKLLEVQIKLNEELDLKVRECTGALQQANEKLQQLNTTDDLTQLRNRRYFTHMLENECQHAFRERIPIAVLMIDIDHFKRVNDTHGHQFGIFACRKPRASSGKTSNARATPPSATAAKNSWCFYTTFVGRCPPHRRKLIGRFSPKRGRRR